MNVGLMWWKIIQTDTERVLTDCGLTQEEIDRLLGEAGFFKLGV